MESKAMKQLLVSLRPQIDAALAEVASRNGLTSLRAGNGTFNPDAGEFTFKLEGKIEGAKGAEAVRYEQNARWLNLPPLGSKFQAGGHEYETAGLNSTGSKVLCKRTEDGKAYLFPAEGVAQRFKPTVTGLDPALPTNLRA